MKNKFLILLSMFVVMLGATIFVACNKYNDEKLMAEKVVTIEYGNRVDFEKFNVQYYKDGETHPLTLKGKKDPYGHYDNPDGDYTWEQIASDTPKQLNVEHPEVGMYDLKLEYQNVSKIVSLVVVAATYPEVISLDVDASTTYLGDKINISLSDEPENAQISYKFYKYTETTTEGDDIYVYIGSRSKNEYDIWNKNTMFMSMFHVGKYKVVAEISITGYKTIATEPAIFEVEKASLTGNYYIPILTEEVKYTSDRLGDYAIPSGFYLQRSSECTIPYDLTPDEYVLSWEDPEQVVGLSDEGIAVVVRFDCIDFKLSDNSDTKALTLRIVAAEFPYAEVGLFVDGVEVDNTTPLDYKESYALSVKVKKTARSRYADLTSDFALTLFDINDDELSGTYTPSETDIQNGYFEIKYQIVSTNGKYKSTSGIFTVYINAPEEPEPDPGE